MSVFVQEGRYSSRERTNKNITAQEDRPPLESLCLTQFSEKGLRFSNSVDGTVTPEEVGDRRGEID